jgi:hypothetical protein
MNHVYRDPAVVPSVDERLSRDMLARELENDERLLWAGRPKSGPYLDSTNVTQLPFLVVWTAIPATMLIQGQLSPIPIAFLAFGLYAIFVRPLLEYRKRARTFYGVTNRRALIAATLDTRSFISVDLSRLTLLSFEEKSDGTGTIWFDRWNLASQPRRGDPTPEPLSFCRVQRAKEVFECIRAVQAELRPEPDDADSDE